MDSKFSALSLFLQENFDINVSVSENNKTH